MVVKYYDRSPKMKNKKLVMILAIAGIFMATAAFAQVNPEGMVSYWKFEEGSGTTALDSVNGNDGTLINGPQWTAGIVGGALSFDGVDDYIDLGNPNNLNPSSELTIAAWVKPIDQGRIVAKDSGGGTERYYFLAVTYPGPSMETGGAVWNTSNELADARGDDVGKYLTEGEWHFIAMTVDSNNIIVYQDGAFLSSDTRSGNLKTGDQNILIGTDALGASYSWYKGLIDEVAIYDRALTPASDRHRAFRKSETTTCSSGKETAVEERRTHF